MSLLYPLEKGETIPFGPIRIFLTLGCFELISFEINPVLLDKKIFENFQSIFTTLLSSPIDKGLNFSF